MQGLGLLRFLRMFRLLRLLKLLKAPPYALYLRYRVAPSLLPRCAYGAPTVCLRCAYVFSLPLFRLRYCRLHHASVLLS